MRKININNSKQQIMQDILIEHLASKHRQNQQLIDQITNKPNKRIIKNTISIIFNIILFIINFLIITKKCTNKQAIIIIIIIIILILIKNIIQCIFEI